MEMLAGEWYHICMLNVILAAYHAWIGVGQTTWANQFWGWRLVALDKEGESNCGDKEM